VANTAKFSELTGWRPKVGVREGVRRLYQWLMASNQHFVPPPVGVNETARRVEAGKI
jgi:hypothetical protein